MSKYIDADRLIHDLEERIYAYSEGYADGDDYRKDAIETLLKDVKYQCSLHQGQPEVDLDENTMKKEFRMIDSACLLFNYDKLSREQLIARRFYLLGLNVRKEE